MTVYIVSVNDKYSDSIIGVFADRGKAHKFALDHESEGDMGTSVSEHVVDSPVKQ